MSEMHFGIFAFTRCRYHRRALSHTKSICQQANDESTTVSTESPG